METQRTTLEGFSAIKVLAALSLLALLWLGSSRAYQAIVKKSTVSAQNSGGAGSLATQASTPFKSVDWQAPVPGGERGPSSIAFAGEDKDGISNIAGNVVRTVLGSYEALVESGDYSPEKAESIAQEIGENLRANVSFTTYKAADLKIESDTSYTRMLTYRNDLRIALEPLLKNSAYELSMFANYVESKDEKYLEELKRTVENYREAIAKTAQVVVPNDALEYHLSILNALSQFSETIDRMAKHADDPFASAALLGTYSGSETNLLSSFNSLALYYKSKLP